MFVLIPIDSVETCSAQLMPVFNFKSSNFIEQEL
jgi:hypothetical protein